jgi:hypothetical protein
VTALDASAALLAIARERLPEADVREGDLEALSFADASAETSWRANASAGVNQMAIAHSGEAAVRDAFTEMDRAHTRPDGSIRYENVFLWVAGERP